MGFVYWSFVLVYSGWLVFYITIMLTSSSSEDDEYVQGYVYTDQLITLAFPIFCFSLIPTCIAFVIHCKSYSDVGNLYRATLNRYWARDGARGTKKAGSQANVRASGSSALSKPRTGSEETSQRSLLLAVCDLEVVTPGQSQQGSASSRKQPLVETWMRTLVLEELRQAAESKAFRPTRD